MPSGGGGFGLAFFVDVAGFFREFRRGEELDELVVKAPFVVQEVGGDVGHLRQNLRPRPAWEGHEGHVGREAPECAMYADTKTSSHA